MSDPYDDPLERVRQIGAPEGDLHEWEEALAAALAERECLRRSLADTVGLLHLADDERNHHAHYGGKRCGECGERWPCSQQIIRDHLATFEEGSDG